MDKNTVFNLEHKMRGEIMEIIGKITWKPGMKPVDLMAAMYSLARTDAPRGVLYCDFAVGRPDQTTLNDVYELAEKMENPAPVAILLTKDVHPMKAQSFNAFAEVFSEFGHAMRVFTSEDEALDWLGTT